MERDLQSAVWDKLLSLPVNFFRHYSSGELAQRAMGISQIRQALSGPVVNTLMSGFFSFFYVVMLFLKGGSLAWLGLGIYAFSMAFTLWLGFSQIKYQRRILDINNDLSGKMFGWLGGLSKIKMTGAEKRIFNNWAELFGHSRNLTFKSRTIGNHITVYNSILMLLTSILVYYAMFAMNHPLAIGSFIAFNAALQLLLASGLQVSATMLQMNEIIPTYQRVKPILEAIPEYDDAKTDPGEISGDIEVSHIHFRYIHDGPLILNDVSLHIESGEHVALVGPSGSGKSTLFRILLGFEKPESGEIFFDSVNLDQLDIRLVRRQLGVVLQSGQLFAGSIFENIAGANISITQKDVMEAIKQAGMEEDLNLMPMGIHTVISEGSGAISGGQRQRLLIARAIAGNPKILFFDEATSALDNKTQKIVSNSINNLKATRITIAHRLSTVQDCDRIIVLENGRITEMGTYHELMNQNGTFAGMAKRQIA
jgi:ATP-binding cassette subfamily C protein